VSGLRCRRVATKSFGWQPGVLDVSVCACSFACPNVNKLLVGNKCDLEAKRAVTFDEAKVRALVSSLEDAVTARDNRLRTLLSLMLWRWCHCRRCCSGAVALGCAARRRSLYCAGGNVLLVVAALTRGRHSPTSEASRSSRRVRRMLRMSRGRL
jgi:hypothetical protein